MDDVAIVGAPLQGVASPGITTVLTIVVPTLNERENIEPLVVLLAETLPDTAWEAIFVDDDSRDGTSEHVRALARRNRGCAVFNGSAGAVSQQLASKVCSLLARPTSR